MKNKWFKVIKSFLDRRNVIKKIPGAYYINNSILMSYNNTS